MLEGRLMIDFKNCWDDAEHKIEGVGDFHSQNHVETVHMASDPFAGGSLFDQALVDYIVSDFERQHKIDLRVDPMTAKRVKDAARAARIELSSKLQSEINEPFVTADATGPKHLLYDLSRSKLEKLCANSVEKVLNVCMRWNRVKIKFQTPSCKMQIWLFWEGWQGCPTLLMTQTRLGEGMQ